MRRNISTVLVLVFSVLFSIHSASGISARVVNLEDMARLSDRVFLGRVVAVEKEYDSRIGTNIVTYSFSVSEGLKGIEDGETVQVRQVSENSDGISPISGLPSYRKGEEVILFLHRDSRLGLTSPVGLSQGVFHTVELPGGEKGYLNGVGNRNLEGSTGIDLKPVLRRENVPGSRLDYGPITLEMLKSGLKAVVSREGGRK